MQRYVLKSLVGLFFVVVSCQVASGHTLSFLRALAEEDQAQRERPVENSVDPADDSIGNPQRESVGNLTKKKDTAKARELLKRLLVKIEGSNTVYQGEPYELTCAVNASPSQTVRWIRGENAPQEMEEYFRESVPSVSTNRDEEVLSTVVAKYVIDCPSEQDQGRIYCFAFSGERAALQSVNINVKENANGTRPCPSTRAPVITLHTPTVIAVQGTSVVLHCRAVGTPRPTTKWTEGNDTLIASAGYDPRYKILETGDLLIEDLRWADMGRIKCVASSTAGTTSAETFIYPAKRES